MKRFLLFVSMMVATSVFAGNPAREVVVYKSPTCGCCKKWVAHMEQNGFKVKSHDVKDVTAIKKENGVTPQLASCHTAFVDGYVIEGHVPANDIKRLLRKRPKVTGLSAPGMPIGSPGMEQGQHKQRYNVISFDKKTGEQKVFSRH